MGGTRLFLSSSNARTSADSRFDSTASFDRSSFTCRCLSSRSRSLWLNIAPLCSSSRSFLYKAGLLVTQVMSISVSHLARSSAALRRSSSRLFSLKEDIGLNKMFRTHFSSTSAARRRKYSSLVLAASSDSAMELMRSSMALKVLTDTDKNSFINP